MMFYHIALTGITHVPVKCRQMVLGSGNLYDGKLFCCKMKKNAMPFGSSSLIAK